MIGITKKRESICIFQAVSVILGAIIGAGFASGREIVSFFAEYGFLSLIFLIPLFFVFFFSIKLLLTCGNCNLTKVASGNLTGFFLFVTYIIFSATMLAGSNKIFDQLLFSFKFPVWSLFVCVLCFLCIKRGFKAIARLSCFLVFAILVMVALCCCLSFFNSSYSPVFFEFDLKNILFLTASIFLYSGVNLILCVAMIKETGKRISKKEINRIAFISSFIICVFIALVVVTLLVCDIASLFVSMPLVELSYTINYIFGICFSVVVFFSIFTTLLTTIFSSSKLLVNYKFSDNSALIFSLFGAFLLSLFGFENIITYAYPIIGAYGLFIVLSEKNNYKSFSMSVVSRFDSGNDEIHSTCQNAKNNRASHDDVKFK